jgi:hypothetical protein
MLFIMITNIRLKRYSGLKLLLTNIAYIKKPLNLY